jgi:predicted Fe-S protein YdhL (DUF1289 family)
MPLFPKISSPCPYVSDLAAIMDGDQCRMCKRQVFDLTAMSDGERVAFLAGCRDEEVCVSYTIPVRPALAAAALAAAAIALPAGSHAQTRARPQQPPVLVNVPIPVAGGIAPAPVVPMVEVPKDATPADIEALYERPAPGAEGKPPAARPPKG